MSCDLDAIVIDAFQYIGAASLYNKIVSVTPFCVIFLYVFTVIKTRTSTVVTLCESVNSLGKAYNNK
jgi:hypothetical protein